MAVVASGMAHNSVVHVRVADKAHEMASLVVDEIRRSTTIQLLTVLRQ